MRPRLLWHCRGGDYVHFALVRRPVYVHERSLLPAWLNDSHGNTVPCRLRVFIYVIYTALHPGRLLVPCGLDTHDGSAVQRGVLWGLCALHGRHVRRPLPLRTRLLLPSRLRDCQRHAVPCGLVLRVNGGRAAAMQTWLLLPVGDLGHDAAAMLLGHVWRCYGAPDARVLRYLHRGVLLPARVY